MHPYIMIDEEGVVVGSGAALNESDIDTQQIPEGMSLVKGVRARPGLDRWDGIEIVAILPPEPTLQDKKNDLLDRLATRRWEVETGGVLLGETAIATDDRSKLLVTDAARKAEADANFTTRWKAMGGWVTLDAATIITIRNKVFGHVSACFAREAVLAELVEAATLETLSDAEAAVAAFWP